LAVERLRLQVAKDNGADHTTKVRDKTADAVRTELEQLTGRPELDAVIECAGSEESIQLSFALPATQGAVASVGLIGNHIDIPLFPFVGKEFTYFGSFWGNYNDLTEVLALAEAGRIKHTVTRVRFDDVNETIDAV
jgi:propanol-preferring alcohol dehydrogenase